MQPINIIPAEPPLDLLARCGGYYEKSNGGPLVGYAARDSSGKQLVGYHYLNFATIERRGNALNFVVGQLLAKFPQIREQGDVFCGAPEGGKALANALALQTAGYYVYPEKKVIEPGTATSREKSKLVWGRHELGARQKVWLVEDICNNFSTTTQMVSLIEDCEAEVLGIICFFNRSPRYGQFYALPDGRAIPVLALGCEALPEYRQDDPAIVREISAWNVVLDPKKDWHKLPESMKKPSRS